jgi:hypothetical protein
MNLRIRDLLTNFAKLRYRYVSAWKQKKYDLCKQLKKQLAEISQELRELGVAVGVMPENLEYLKISLSTCAATDPNTVTCLLRDIEGVFEVYEKPVEKPYTLRNFEIFNVEADGSLSIPEPTEPDPPPEIPDHPATRNCDLKRSE